MTNAPRRPTTLDTLNTPQTANQKPHHSTFRGGVHTGALPGGLARNQYTFAPEGRAQDLGAVFDDPVRRVFLTDEQGVVLAGNQANDVLKRSPLMGMMSSDRDDDLRLYQQQPAALALLFRTRLHVR